MHAVLVDPATRTVTDIDVDGQLETLQRLVDGYIEGLYPGYADAELDGIHGYCDEEFLYSGKDRSRPWSLPGYPHLLGPGVFMCSTPDGGEAPCNMSAAQFSKYVRWHFG